MTTLTTWCPQEVWQPRPSPSDASTADDHWDAQWPAPHARYAIGSRGSAPVTGTRGAQDADRLDGM